MPEKDLASRAVVGTAAPSFEVDCVDSARLTPRRVNNLDFLGRWLTLVFYPRDFSFVCPTELTAFSARQAEFQQRECELFGVSVDSIELHQEWLARPESDGGLAHLRFPLGSDVDGALSRAYGVWVDDEEISARGLFIIDPSGDLQYAVIHNLNVGRSVDEVLRVLDGLRTGGLCPASWTTADGTMDVERALKPGSVLGHYRIRSQVGSGTFGTVFAAMDLRLQRIVALKILKRDIVQARESLLIEARSAARLNHPNVCTVYAIDEEEGLPVIAMEYLDGKTLSQLIAEGISRDDAVDIATQIASGLAAAHQQALVHGDLKPANIMVGADGATKILDFGLAMNVSRPGVAPQGELPASDETGSTLR